MFLSVFDIFKLSVGPSSSHTMGPMLAARRFIDGARQVAISDTRQFQLRCQLFGSLAYTGEGHGTFRAVLLGLLGFSPATYDAEVGNRELAELALHRSVIIGRGRSITLDPDQAIVAERGRRLPLHPNALRFCLLAPVGVAVASETYYSIGGGFILTEAELSAGPGPAVGPDVPYPFATAVEMLAMGEKSGLSIAEMSGPMNG